MSEVKTYKCDICGAVYHVEESCVETITMVCKTQNLERGEVKKYEHICPKCGKYIKAHIQDPKMWEKHKDEEIKLHRAKSKLEHCLSRLYHNVMKPAFFMYDPIDITYYEDVTNVICEKIEERDNRINKQLWVIRIVSLLLGMCIGAAIAQIIG